MGNQVKGKRRNHGRAPAPRRTLFDTLDEGGSSNLFCDRANLSNEASVETFFANRLLEDLDYRDSQIQTKKSIRSLTVSLGGSKSAPYKPDYVLTSRKRPRWVIDAKGPEENLDKWVTQCGGYCLGLNRTFKRDNPVRWFMLTNGIETRLYEWDSDTPVLTLAFEDFASGNPKYEQLRSLVSATSIVEAKSIEQNDFRFERPSPQKAKQLFAQCNKLIRASGHGHVGAFTEFTKLMFVKLWRDSALRSDKDIAAIIDQPGVAKLPADAVAFSVNWIEKQQSHSANPVNDILFKGLRDEIEEKIAQQKKKRIFAPDEKIDIHPDTIKLVVAKLEHWDMRGIDDDLNGRLFETFLNATMRGRELGQYFTPRSVVKLVTRLANLKVTRTGAEKVVDACCGTGGFLIEVLTEMRNSVRSNRSLSKDEEDRLITEICNESIYGIDFGKSPPLARIARINMYLHGDGGSRIYYADALDKDMEIDKTEDPEIKRDQGELKKALEDGLKFQCALTNPPFSMIKDVKNKAEAKLLKRYELAAVEGTSKFRSLQSNEMFIERYRDLLEDGGRLLTVIDDSLLAGDDFAPVRDFIRQHFMIRGIISLPGDAFQRSGARVKTSVLYLTKRGKSHKGQPGAFVFECRYVGLDDVVLRTRPSVAESKRQLAVGEINEVVSAFGAYLDGKEGPWLVPAERLSGRLDAKFLRPWRASELEPTWKKSGATPDVLDNLVEPVWEPVNLVADHEYSFLRVTYAGRAERGEKSLGREVGYSQVSTAQAGDIVVSNINAVNRASCVLPPEGEGWLISKEFTILRPRKNVKLDTYYLWTVLRSAAVIAEWLSGATGVGRHRVDWGLLQRQRVPLLPYDEQKEIGDKYRMAQEYERKIRKLRAEAQGILTPLELEGDLAKDRLERAKPPK
jgi:type I restriction enzyme M protein